MRVGGYGAGVDCLYILGVGSKWDNNELRYSLRSLERFCPDVSRVFVVGANPGFLSSEVVYVPKKDASHNKEYNIAEKLYWSFLKTDLSDDVLFLNDDHFLLAPLDPATYPYYHRGPLLDHIRTGKIGSTYRMSLVYTHNMLSNRRVPAVHFDVHTPIRYNRHLFMRLEKTWEMSARMGRSGYVVKSSYCNLNNILARPEHKLTDCKINGAVKGVDDVKRIVRGRHVFSCDDDAINLGVSEFLAETFPEKSRFER